METKHILTEDQIKVEHTPMDSLNATGLNRAYTVANGEGNDGGLDGSDSDEVDGDSDGTDGDSDGTDGRF